MKALCFRSISQPDTGMKLQGKIQNHLCDLYASFSGSLQPYMGKSLPLPELGDVAAHRVNDSKYGLQAGVFTHDMDKAWYAFEHMEVGGVVWNHVPSIRVDAQVRLVCESHHLLVMCQRPVEGHLRLMVSWEVCHRLTPYHIFSTCLHSIFTIRLWMAAPSSVLWAMAFSKPTAIRRTRSSPFSCISSMIVTKLSAL